MEEFLGKRVIDNNPPGQEIGIRTMESDIKAIQLAGGETSSVQAQNFSEKRGVDSEEPVFVPKTDLFLEKSPAVGGNSSSRKIIWMVVSAFAIGVVFSALGYFVIFPLFLK